MPQEEGYWKGFLKLVSVFKEGSKNLAFKFLSNKDKKILKPPSNIQKVLI
jgi:hypothetical protein